MDWRAYVEHDFARLGLAGLAFMSLVLALGVVLVLWAVRG